MDVNVVLDFIHAINSTDVDRIYGLMTENHLFIDSQDHRMNGKENMKQAWTAYFALFPDYKIEINEIVEKDSLICILGYASGTYKGIEKEHKNNYWRIPAAWTAIVSDNKIKQWQVYADNLIVADIINRNK
jgi:ketosteroid isomerase-like protein